MSNTTILVKQLVKEKDLIKRDFVNDILLLEFMKFLFYLLYCNRLRIMIG